MVRAAGPWIYEGWVNDFPTLYVATVDLHEGLDVSRASMDDYAERVVAMAAIAPQPAALCGWSMGGLAVLQAAGRVQPHSVIVLEPSAPAEIAGWDLDVQLTEGTFDPEAVYGPFPGEVPGRPESSLARAERKRGISVPSLPCASLVIYGDEFRDERGVAVARLYGASEHHFSGLDHWDRSRSTEPNTSSRPCNSWAGLEGIGEPLEPAAHSPGKREHPVVTKGVLGCPMNDGVESKPVQRHDAGGVEPAEPARDVAEAGGGDLANAGIFMASHETHHASTQS
jgi:pimeloyl-ACP methyl ester carboxylesterase